MGTWVRYESRATALGRYRTIAEAIERTATDLVSCGEEGSDPNCETIAWPDTERELALSALTIALYESSLREDIQFGRKRGSAGEACLVQVMPKEAPRFASWLPLEERERLGNDPAAREAFLKTLLGDSNSALSHCFEIGMRMLARARLACGSAQKKWAEGMFSMYGTGTTCSAHPLGEIRGRTLYRFLASRPRIHPRDAATLGLTDPFSPQPSKTNTAARPNQRSRVERLSRSD